MSLIYVCFVLQIQAQVEEELLEFLRNIPAPEGDEPEVLLVGTDPVASTSGAAPEETPAASTSGVTQPPPAKRGYASIYVALCLVITDSRQSYCVSATSRTRARHMWINLGKF